MKERMINRVYLEGVLYQHNLELRVTGEQSKKPGTEYIRGTIDIATNDALTNIVQVNYTYVTKFTSTGKEDSRYTILKDIFDGKVKTYMDVGAQAAKVRVDSALGLNEWYSTRDKDENGEPILVSQKINQGGFIHLLNKPLKEREDERSFFETDMFITKVREVEENPERNLPRKVVISGVVFDFRNAILPVSFDILNPGGMDYFLSQDISSKNPLFTKVSGKEVSQVSVRKITEESAWGEDLVREVQSTNRAFVVTYSSATPYEVTDDFIAKLSEKVKEREMVLAERKNRALQAVKPTVTPNPVVTNDFDF